MKKKLWGISLAAALAIGLTACGGSQETADTQPGSAIYNGCWDDDGN